MGLNCSLRRNAEGGRAMSVNFLMLVPPVPFGPDGAGMWVGSTL